MIIEQGSQAYRLAQLLNAGSSPPDHAGTILFMARLLRPVANPASGYQPRLESI